MRSLLAVLLLLLPAAAQDLRFARGRPLDLLHLRLDARVDLERKTLEGRATLEMQALLDTGHIRLDAVALDVKRASAGETEVDAVNDGKSLLLTLPEPLKRGEKATVVVDYRCVDPEAGLYFFGPTEAEPDTPYQVWSQGETTDNRHWIPLFDHPNERLTTELVITVKDGLQVLSNGKRMGVTKKDGWATWHWKQERDHVPYLITLVVGTFAVKEHTWRGKTVSYWVPPDRADDIERSFGNTTRMLDLFSERIGVLYPWEKYAQIVVEQFKHGGMENTSATTLTERTLHDARAHADYSSDGLVAHELAHQWFGDLLTCRDWAHTWLNEGFATYFEAIWAEHDKGADEFAYTMLGKMRGALSGGKKLPIVHRAYKSNWEQFDARAYPKGAWVLHMIRRRLGDEMWWRCVNRYTEKHAYRCVETVDLRKAIEETTGLSFERFFHDWTARPGHPVVTVHHEWRPGEGQMEVRVRQTQKGGAFHFPLRLVYSKGPRSWRITHDVKERDVRFYVPLPVRPALVSIDPHNAVLMELRERKARDWWVAQLRHDPNPIARIRAAEHFGKSKRDQDRRALADALGAEGFWGVQAEIAKALGESGGSVSRDVLLQALSLEHPKARREVVRALGRFREDATVRDALGALVRNGDASYYVEADAIESWGGMRPKGALAVLEPLLARKSHNEVVRAAALRAIGAQHDPAATDLLLEWTSRGRPRSCRAAALDALGKLAGAGRWDEATTNRVADTVRACLRPAEHRRIKTQAVRTLRVLGEQASPALGALEALAAHDRHPNVRKQAQETIDKIRAGAPPRLELQRLREELRKLRESNERMRDRIERIDGKTPDPGSG